MPVFRLDAACEGIDGWTSPWEEDNLILEPRLRWTGWEWSSLGGTVARIDREAAMSGISHLSTSEISRMIERRQEEPFRCEHCSVL